MENGEVYERIMACIQGVLSGSEIEENSLWLLQFYQERESISILLSIIGQFPNSTHRLFIIIALQRCIANNWELLSDEEKAEKFQTFLELMRAETVALNRQNIHFLIQLTCNEDFYPIILPFIEELSNTGSPIDLSNAIMMANLIVNTTGNEEINRVLMSTLDKGFNSDDIDVRIRAFYYLLFAQKPFNIEELIPTYWERSLEILTPSVHRTDFKNVCAYFSFACTSSCKYEFDVIPLLDICLTLARAEGGDADKMLCIARIIEAICEEHTEEVLQSELVNSIIEVFVLGSTGMFEPDDALTLSTANFFEKTFSVLCNSDEVLQYLYSLFVTFDATDAFHFIIVRSMAVMFKCSREFFQDKLSEVADVLAGGIRSESLLLIEGAVQATDTYFEYFSTCSDELTIQLLGIVIEAAQSAPTVDIINSVAHMLEVTKQTDEFFDTTFEFALQLISQGEPVVQQAALNCLMVLARFSSTKISENLENFMQVLFEILGSSEESADVLRPQVVDCLQIVANNVGQEFDPYAPTYLEFIVANLQSEGVQLALTCFSALQLMAEKYPEDFSQIIDDIIQSTVSKASYDASPQFRKAILDQPKADYNEIVEEFHPLFQESALALRLLSSMLKLTPELCNTLRMHTLQCCSTQSHSDSPDCRAAAANAIFNLADAIASPEREPPINETTQMGYVLLTLLPAPEEVQNFKDIIDPFETAAHVIDVLDYHAFGLVISQFLSITRNYIIYFLQNRSLVAPSQETIQAISQFLSMVAASAGPMATTILQSFLSLTQDLVDSGEPILKAFSLTFISDIIAAAGDSIDVDFKRSAMELAMTVADQEIEPTAFTCIRLIAKSYPELAEEVVEEVYRICFEKLSMDVIKTEQFYLMRDCCLITFAYFIMNVIEDRIDYHEYLIKCLEALPLVVDFENADLALNFFFYLYEKGKEEYRESFLQILVKTFGMPPHLLDNTGILEPSIQRMKELCIELLSAYTNQDEIVSAYLDGDPGKIQYFVNAIQPPEEEPEEGE